MIEARDLHKSYKGLKAVDGVSFEVARGETFGFLGPNGAGKSTTIHMLTGLLRPDSGEVVIDGEADPTRPELRRRIGIAPQSLSLYDELTGEENLHFFGRLYGLGGAALRERAAFALAFTALSDRARDRVRTYSGGMKRRLNIALAVLHDPPVMLFDEPTVGVDPQSRNLIFENLEALKAEGRTILYTTHYMEEAHRLCDRVAIVDRGRILALDTVEALIRDHGGNAIVEVEFERPPSPAVAESFEASFNETSGFAWRLEGAHLTVETDHPMEAVARIAASGERFLRLEVERADLEEVFLELTGRNLRDD